MKKRLFTLCCVLLPMLSALPVHAQPVLQQECIPASSALTVFPKDGRSVWINAIEKAARSIYISAYKLTDPLILSALEKAKENTPTLEIYCLLETAPFIHEKSGGQLTPFERIKKMGVHIFHLSQEQVHAKMFLVDNTLGLIGTGNWDEESFDGIPSQRIPPARDFALTITDPILLAQMEQWFFQAIKHPKELFPQPRGETLPHLVWGSEHRPVIMGLIAQAKESIKIYQQDLQDMEVTEALLQARTRGVTVEVMMTPFPFSKTVDKNTSNQHRILKSGGFIYPQNHLYIHAKILLIDGKMMYLGSCNFYPQSLDAGHELGIVTEDPLVIHQISQTFDEDKKHIDRRRLEALKKP